MTKEVLKKKAAAAGPAKIIAAATPEEPTATVSPSHANDTTPSWAETRFAAMGVGRKHAVYVNSGDAYDKDTREFKRLVAQERKAGTPIISGRDCYYWIADMTDERDRDALEHQINSLLSRARELERAAYAMKDATEADRRYEHASYTGYCSTRTDIWG